MMAEMGWITYGPALKSSQLLLKTAFCLRLPTLVIPKLVEESPEPWSWVMVAGNKASRYLVTNG